MERVKSKSNKNEVLTVNSAAYVSSEKQLGLSI